MSANNNLIAHAVTGGGILPPSAQKQKKGKPKEKHLSEEKKERAR
jgi:hypothetical protein